jgi:hypothetical protein
MALKLGQRQPLESKAWRGVRDVEDPYSVPPNYLQRARNMYLPDPGSGSGVYQRPGFGLPNEEAPLADTDTGRIGQGIIIATVEDGTQLNFCVCGGRLFRVSPDFLMREDVTPDDMPIDLGGRVHLTPFSNRLLVNDDLNTPWVASDLQSTPVTGTIITYSTEGVPWRAYGPAGVYDDAAVWVVRYRDTESRTARIGWSETDDPLAGYFQTDFDNEWDVIQNDTDTIWAVHGTNLALDYFREGSIGYLSGTIGNDFRTTATKDAIDSGVGSRAPATIKAFGNYVYFADTKGRVHRYQQGGGLETLWKQHRRVVNLSPTGFVDNIARMSCAALVPELDLYLVAIWSPDPTQSLPQFPTVLYAFHAETGRYAGDWTIGPGIAVHSIGVMVGADGQKVLAVLGTKDAPGDSQALGDGGYLWTLSSLADGIWTDNGQLPDLSVTIPTLGYDPDMMITVDGVVAVVQELESDPTPAEIDLAVD